MTELKPNELYGTDMTPEDILQYLNVESPSSIDLEKFKRLQTIACKPWLAWIPNSVAKLLEVVFAWLCMVCVFLLVFGSVFVFGGLVFEGHRWGITYWLFFKLTSRTAATLVISIGICLYLDRVIKFHKTKWEEDERCFDSSFFDSVPEIIIEFVERLNKFERSHRKLCWDNCIRPIVQRYYNLNIVYLEIRFQKYAVFAWNTKRPHELMSFT